MIYKGINPVFRIHALSCPFLAAIPHVPAWKVRHFPSGPPLLLVFLRKEFGAGTLGIITRRISTTNGATGTLGGFNLPGGAASIERASDSVQLYG